jgi:hypothetical protein
MRYLINVIDNASGTGTPEEGVAIDAFNDMLEARGHWILAGGITAPSNATLIDNRAGAGLIANEPLHDTTEYVSGFWVIEASSDEEAMALATEGSKACNRRVEVRPFIR